MALRKSSILIPYASALISIVLASGSLGEGQGPRPRQCHILQPSFGGFPQTFGLPSLSPILFPLDTFQRQYFQHYRRPAANFAPAAVLLLRVFAPSE